VTALDVKSGLSRRGLLAAGRNLAIVLLLGIGFLVASVVSGWIVPPYLFILAAALPVAGIALLGAGRDRSVWIVYILGFVVFAYLRALADETPIPVQFSYAIDLERALFLGTVPTIWLQARFYQLGQPSLVDQLTVFIHFTYFFVPHVFAFTLWRQNHLVFRRYVAAALGCYYFALLSCFVLPTAPPWLAGQIGQLVHVYRVVEDVLTKANPTAYDYAYQVAGTNAVAAMPSLHFAIAYLIALASREVGIRAGALGVSYAIAMACALVYAGEHYVVDLIAGGVLAVVAWRIALRAESWSIT
jgi:membrane-associated phospholipid phosphatase